MLTKSKRANLAYVVLLVWVLFGIYGIKMNADLFGLSAYFGVFAIKFGVYIWGETKRPSVNDDGTNK